MVVEAAMVERGEQLQKVGTTVTEAGGVQEAGGPIKEMSQL